MKKLTVVLCSWRSPDLLKPCIDSLKKSFTQDAQIIAVLNEGDRESVNFLLDEGIAFIKLNENYGTLAVDFAAHQIRSEYIANVNDDMLFHEGWDSDLIGIIERNYPASASCRLVEPRYSGNPAVTVDDLGPFDRAFADFIARQREGRYSAAAIYGYNHPIMVKTEDYVKVYGYSDRFDMNWFPGFSLDAYFPWRLWRLHQEKFKFIVSGKSCVYHGVSLTNNKLPPEARARDGSDYFIHRTGMSINQFKSVIRCDSLAHLTR